MVSLSVEQPCLLQTQIISMMNKQKICYQSNTLFGYFRRSSFALLFCFIFSSQSDLVLQYSCSCGNIPLSDASTAKTSLTLLFSKAVYNPLP